MFNISNHRALDGAAHREPILRSNFHAAFKKEGQFLYRMGVTSDAMFPAWNSQFDWQIHQLLQHVVPWLCGAKNRMIHSEST